MLGLLTPRSLSSGMLALIGIALSMMYTLCLALYFARLHNSGEQTYFYIPANLTLAALPFIFAVCTHLLTQRRSLPRVPLTMGFAILWLLFLPNAPYVVTDLQHYEDSALIAGWYDGLMLGSFVWTALLMGLVSLYIMHGVFSRVAGTLFAWAIILAVMPLCGFAIYMGRIRRWNSWEAIVDPLAVAHDLVSIATEPLLRSEAFAMTVGFGAFLAATYITLFAVASMGAMKPRA